MDKNDQDNKKAVVKVPLWCASLIGALVIAIIVAFLYLQFIRYSLVSQAIDLKDTTTSALLLSPEIATGLVKIFALL